MHECILQIMAMLFINEFVNKLDHSLTWKFVILNIHTIRFYAFCNAYSHITQNWRSLYVWYHVIILLNSVWFVDKFEEDIQFLHYQFLFFPSYQKSPTCNNTLSQAKLLMIILSKLLLIITTKFVCANILETSFWNWKYCITVKVGGLSIPAQSNIYDWAESNILLIWYYSMFVLFEVCVVILYYQMFSINPSSLGFLLFFILCKIVAHLLLRSVFLIDNQFDW